MGGTFALVRATHLNDYIAVLRGIGAPVDRELERSRLPQRIEETPDLYVSVPVALEWIARTGHDLRPMELGLLAAQRASLSSLRLAQQAAIMTAQTGLRRLEALAALSRFEDSALAISIRREGDNVRVTCAMEGFAHHPLACLADWLNLQAVMSIVRSVAGASWAPSDLCFSSPHPPPDSVQATYPDTRILIGRPSASIVIGADDLARPTDDMHAPAASADEESRLQGAWAFPALLRALVQPYLGDGGPDIAFVAELAGVSTRTLQRKLRACDSTYSQLLQEARFGLARLRLSDPGLKVIEVAMMAGYENPQHFTRAFRRFAGVTPSEYRKQDHAAATASEPHGP
jgi:AraC-like DNA-binding protein